MTLSTWWLFILMTFVVSATPGPNMLFVMSISARYGIRAAVMAMLGCMTALLAMMSISAAGLGALLQAFPTVFEALRLAGAAFARGLALRFPGEMTFANPFGHRRLRATVGLDWDGHTPRCADAEKCERAVFQVRGDGGRVLFTSGGRKYSDPPLELDVDLEGSREVTLAVWGGRLWLNGTAVWAMARFE